jgi:autotransporter-associated beta strand protein
LYGKIENNSANLQTFNLTLGVNAAFIEVNPVNGDLTVGSPNVYLNGNQLRVWGNNSKTLTFGPGSVISGTGGSFALNENSTVIYQSAHTYSGDTYINAGTLRFNSGGSASSSTLRLGNTSGTAGAALAVASGANLNSTLVVRSGSSGTKTIGGLAGSGTATISGNVYLDGDATVTSASGGTLNFTGTEFDLKNQTLTVNSAGSVSISGVLKNTTGSGKLTKTGAGTLTLSGANTYSGLTTVNEGTLVVNNAIGAGGVTVSPGATLGGSGTIGGTVALNGTIAPGASVGTLTTGNKTWNGGASYAWEINDAAGAAGTGYDTLNLGSGTLDIQASSGSKFTLNLVSLNGSSPGQAANFNNNNSYTWTLASAGTVNNFAADKFTINDSQFQNDLAGGVFSVETGSLKLRFTPNQAPVANNAGYSRTKGLTLKINKADLLAASTSDPDGDGRQLVSLGSPGSGGTVAEDSTWIYYTPPGGGGDDSFSYTVRDTRSYRAGDTVRTATASINITEVTAVGLVQTITTGGGAVTVNFAGIPGHSYQVQRADDVNFTVNVTTLTTITAPAAGLFSYTDNSPPTPTAYYRLMQP